MADIKSLNGYNLKDEYSRDSLLNIKSSKFALVEFPKIRPLSKTNQLDLFITFCNLLTGKIYNDIEGMCTAYNVFDKEYYYQDFETLASELKNGTLLGGESSNANIKVFTFKSSTSFSKVVYIKALNSVTSAKVNFDVEKYIVLDINGCALQFNGGAITTSYPCCIYGRKANSYIKVVSEDSNDSGIGVNTITGSKIIGGRYDFEFSGTQNKYSRTDFYIHKMTNGARPSDEALDYEITTYFKDVQTTNYIQNFAYLQTSITSKSSFLNDNTKDVLIIDGCNTLSTNMYGDASGISYQGILCIRNSTVISKSKDMGDNTYSCIMSNNQNKCCIIDDSYIYGSNTATGDITEGRVYIHNSKLYGSIHGGIYAVDSVSKNICNPNYVNTAAYFNGIINSKYYITDSEIGLLDASLYTSSNPYSCYIGYNACVYCDGVKFTSEHDSIGTIAIKTGDNARYMATSVYLSNCDMNGIRCDAYCFAALGHGIGDNVKNQAVSGTKEITDDVYRYIPVIANTNS